MKILLAGILALALTVGWSPENTHASVVTANIQVDDAFSFYISTSDTVPGTFIGSGDRWDLTYNFSDLLLTPHVVNYLHIMAYNSGGATGFTGDFTLSDTMFAFASGTQYLTTDLTHWTVTPYGSTGFGQNPGAPIMREGGIWMYDPGYWDHPATAYFSAQIYATPEPSTYALFCLGLGGLAVMKLRKNRRGV